jgi:hypothetical protein
MLIYARRAFFNTKAEHDAVKHGRVILPFTRRA